MLHEFMFSIYNPELPRQSLTTALLHPRSRLQPPTHPRRNTQQADKTLHHPAESAEFPL